MRDLKKYSCGFLFCGDDPIETARVLLIRKNRPGFQVGKLNGIGGGIEEGETPAAGMARECSEEANVVIDDWTLRWIVVGEDHSIFFYYAFCPEDVFLQARQMTDEALVTVRVNELDGEILVDGVGEFLSFVVNDFVMPGVERHAGAVYVVPSESLSVQGAPMRLAAVMTDRDISIPRDLSELMKNA